MRMVSKYRAVKTVVDGMLFDSKREAEVWISLQALRRAGTIVNLERQVKFPLHGVDDKGKPGKVCIYIADFVFQDLDGHTNVYDAKGYKTAMYRLKKKWFELQYGLRIVEV